MPKKFIPAPFFGGREKEDKKDHMEGGRSRVIVCFLVTLFCGRTFCDHPSNAAVGGELKQLYINVMNDMKEKKIGSQRSRKDANKHG